MEIFLSLSWIDWPIYYSCSIQYFNISIWKSLKTLCISNLLLAKVSLRDSTNHSIHRVHMIYMNLFIEVFDPFSIQALIFLNLMPSFRIPFNRWGMVMGCNLNIIRVSSKCLMWPTRLPPPLSSFQYDFDSHVSRLAYHFVLQNVSFQSPFSLVDC